MALQCRACGEPIYTEDPRNIFKPENKTIRLNIEALTGIHLIGDKNLPKYICNCCHLDLYHSISFRERCINTEKLLQRAKQQAENVVEVETSESEEDSKPLVVKPDPLNMLTKQNLAIGKTTVEPDVKNVKALIKDESSDEDEWKLQEPDPWPDSPIEAAPEPRTLRSGTQNAKAESKTQKKRPTKVKKAPKVVPEPEATNSKCAKKNTAGKIEPIASVLTSCESPAPNQKLIEDKSAAEPSVEPSLVSASPTKISGNPEVKKIRRRKERCQSNAPKIHMCDQCGYRSSCKRALAIHILRHKGEKNFECEECGLKFYNASMRKLHIRVKHQGEKPFDCKYCGQSFYTPSARGRHENMHTNERPYACDICGKTFSLSTTLKAHALTHTKEKPHKCLTCKKGFRLPHQLKAHEKTHTHRYEVSITYDDYNQD
ncbi:CG18764, partial [Drosophila busckii]